MARRVSMTKVSGMRVRVQTEVGLDGLNCVKVAWGSRGMTVHSG